MPLAAEKLPWGMTDWNVFEKHNETLVFLMRLPLLVYRDLLTSLEMTRCCYVIPTEVEESCLTMLD